MENNNITFGGSIKRKFSIVLPVYTGIELLCDLLDSLEETSSSTNSHYLAELIIINDNPDDKELDEFLRSRVPSLSISTRVLLNATNRGFVASVNRGFEAAPTENDVLILNSDTVVYPGWIENLESIVAKLEEQKISWGTLTPFSNAATIATIPRMGEEYSEFHNQSSPQSVAALCRRLFDEHDELPEVPVGIGYCMLMNRKALANVGPFLDIFSPGYGEETDWCLRATQQGFRHFIASNTFVYHVGGHSFSERKAALIERCNKLIAKLHPTYFSDLQAYTDSPSSHRYHRMVAPFIDFLSRLKSKQIAIHLVNRDISLAPGGLEKYVEETCGFIAREGKASNILIYPIEHEALALYRLEIDGQEFAAFSADSLQWIFSVLSELDLIDIRSVTLQHAMNWNFDDLLLLSEYFAKTVSRRNVITHDYYLICEQHNLLWDDIEFTGAPVDVELLRSGASKYGASTIQHLARSKILLAHYNHIICPSDVTKRIFESVFPDSASKFSVAPHYVVDTVVDAAEQEHSEKISLIFLGATGHNKGIHHYEQLLETHGEKFSWLTVGIEDRFASNGLVEHVDYSFRDSNDLMDILRSRRPAFVVLPSVWPETFSYTLHEALQAGLPVLTLSVSGNIAEQVLNHEQGFVAASVEELSDYLSNSTETFRRDIARWSKQRPASLNTEAITAVYL